jgi:uncharacterized protein (DUF1697 family)
MPRYVALLRGINLGGKNMLPMKDLAAMFVDLGCSNVRSYIQSGNVVFEASPKPAVSLPQAATAAIQERFGRRPPVLLRSASELARALEANPFLARGVPSSELYVAFLADKPPKARIDALDAARATPDAYEVAGRDIYLHLPNGGARSKLTNDYFDRTLATVSTIRNWRTVEQLASMLAS